MLALTETPLCVLQIEYNFRWLQTPLEKRLWDKSVYRPLAAVNVIKMNDITNVSFSTSKSLFHQQLWLLCAGDGVLQPPGTPQSPRLQKVPCDEMVQIAHLTPFRKWIARKMMASADNFCSIPAFSMSNFCISLFRRVAYGSKAHFLNILLYLMGLMPLTYLILSLRPSVSTDNTGHHNITMVPVSFQEVGLTDAKIPQKPKQQAQMTFFLFFLAKCAPVLLHDDGPGYEHLRHNKGAGTDVTTGTAACQVDAIFRHGTQWVISFPSSLFFPLHSV